MPRLITRLLWWLPAVAWASCILYFSSIPDLALASGASDFVLRKTAHVLVYAGLLVLIYIAIQQSLSTRWSPSIAIRAILLTTAYAIFDEAYQSTVPTRHGDIIDVLIDMLGVGLGLAIIGWLQWWRHVTDQPDTNPISSFNYMGQSVTQKDLPKLVSKLTEVIKPGQTIALQGDLGAGKTTFAKQLIQALGSTKTVTSPTYIIEKQYPTTRGYTIYHHDWYRLSNEEEVQLLGIQDKFNQPNAIILIEWPERATDILPSNTMWIHFTYVDQQTRKIIINR